MIEFKLSTIEEARQVGENLRPSDANELALAFGEPPIEVCVESVQRSVIAWTALKNGIPIAIFGVAHFKPGVGLVWLLATPQADVERRAFLVSARKYVGHMARIYPVLFNFVLSANTRSRAWLKRLGFVEDKQLPEYGVGRAPFSICVYRSP